MAYQDGCLNYSNSPSDKNDYWEPHANHNNRYCSDEYGDWPGAGHDNYSNDHSDSNGPRATCLQNHIDNGGHTNYNANYNYHSDNHTDNGGHNNTCTVNAIYRDNYNNHTNVHAKTPPAAWSLRNGNQPSDADSWLKLSDGIQDIKDLRDDIRKISETKVKKDGTKITLTPAETENADVQFAAGKKARAAQINETISNLKTLWQDIKGEAGSGWPTTKTAGSNDKILKNDYKALIQKAKDLAETTCATYLNHANYGTNISRNYSNGVHTDTWTGVHNHVDNS